ncbi:uncharacterized protein LOC123543293 [Mercenaria mercenaria]|uniref:uncharacterized protein LOC123543293 n=1 Tax=Mercenaria mercenaria TaxID=6596 RepID=UPI00234ECD4C|nr:uncharacterized protein LOC123543293 [Mercenaria mercenaria]
MKIICLALVLLSSVLESICEDSRCGSDKCCSRFEQDVQIFKRLSEIEEKETSLQESINSLQRLVNSQQSLINSQQALIAELQQNQPQNKDAMFPTNVIFQATSISKDTLADGQTIVFTQIKTNNGTGYDNTSGIFTVPTDGVYLFSLQLCIENVYFYFDITTDARLLLSGIFTDEKPQLASCHTASTAATLMKDERVFVKYRKKSSHRTGLWSSNTERQTFSGVLIYK